MRSKWMKIYKEEMNVKGEKHAEKEEGEWGEVTHRVQIFIRIPIT